MRATVFVASWCEPCHEAVAYMRGRGVAVQEIDVEENPERAASAGVTEVPVIVFEGGPRIVGFKRDRINAAIGSSGIGLWAGLALAGVGLVVAGYILVR